MDDQKEPITLTLGDWTHVAEIATSIAERLRAEIARATAGRQADRFTEVVIPLTTHEEDIVARLIDFDLMSQI